MSRVLPPGEEECEQRVGEKSLLLETQCSEDEGEDGAAAVWVWRAAHQKSETGEQTEEKEARGWRVVTRVCASYRRERVLISWDDMQREKRKAERKEK